MFTNYLITAVRNFSRYRSGMPVNVVGLALGFACVTFIAMFVRDELSYDRWIPGSLSLYRAEVTLNFPGAAPVVTASAPFILAQTMESEIPEVVAATPFHPARLTLTVDDRKFSQEITFVDPRFFEIVRLHLARGDARTVLSTPQSLVISAAMGLKLFGNANPIGRTVLLEGQHQLVVTGVVQDLPYNTQLEGDIFAPTTSPALPLAPSEKANWLTFTKYVYLALAPQASAASVTPKIQDLFVRHLDTGMLTGLHMRGDDLIHARLTPFVQAHLSTDRYSNPKSAGSLTVVYGFLAIGALILLMACFNFVNLCTAHATARAREIAIRKVLGGRRGQIVVQLLCESVLLSVCAWVLSLSLAEMLRHPYERLVGHPSPLHSWLLVSVGLIVAVLTGVLSGLYPALVLSAFRPAETLNSGGAPLVGSAGLRRTLVIAQFVISIGLGTAAVVVFLQVHYAQRLDLEE